MEYLQLSPTFAHFRINMLPSEVGADDPLLKVVSALDEGNISYIESLVEIGAGNEGTTMLVPAEAADLLTRAHLAILVDKPKFAASYFESAGEIVEEFDVNPAWHILIDGADQLGRIGCKLGPEWLGESIILYEKALGTSASSISRLELAIARHNLGAFLLVLGLEENRKDHTKEILVKSLNALRMASRDIRAIPGAPDRDVYILYRNVIYAISKLSALGEHDPSLDQERAVARRQITNVETMAVEMGGEQALERIRASASSILIEPEWDPTIAQARRLFGESDPCQKLW